MKTDIALENRFFYRLVKVAYFFAMGAVILFILLTFKNDIQRYHMAKDQAYVFCNNGKNFPLINLMEFDRVKFLPDLPIEPNMREFNLSARDIETITRICKIKDLKTHDSKATIGEIAKQNKLETGDVLLYYVAFIGDKGVSKGEKFIVENKTFGNFSLKLLRDWSLIKQDLLDWFLFLLLFYVIANIVREGLVYLAFGKKFTWNWLFLTNINKVYRSLLKIFKT